MTLAVMAVVMLADLHHSGRDLTIIAWQVKLNIFAIGLAGIMRVLPQLIDGFLFAYYQYMMSSLFGTPLLFYGFSLIFRFCVGHFTIINQNVFSIIIYK